MSNRLFTMVPGTIWSDQKFKNLPTDLDRYLFIYILTSGHQNLAGTYGLPDGYAATDLGWTVEEYQQRREHLVVAGFIKFDSTTSEVMVVDWFQWNPASGLRVTPGIRRVVSNIKSTHVRAALEQALNDAQAPHPQSDDPTAVTFNRFHTRHMLEAPSEAARSGRRALPKPRP